MTTIRRKAGQGGYTPTTQHKNRNAPGEKPGKGNSFEFTATYPLSTGEMSVSKKELDKKFKCRICGHDKCEFRLNMYAYVCCGCSVVFENIEMFSKQKS